MRSPHTTLAFMVKQSKVPKLLRQKAKDTISALDFICDIDDLVRTDSWSDTITYSYFVNGAWTENGSSQWLTCWISQPTSSLGQIWNRIPETIWSPAQWQTHHQHNERKLQTLPEQGRGTTKWCQLLDHPCQKSSKWHRQQSDTILLDATVLGSSSQSVVKCGGPEGLHQGYTGQDVQCWQDSADMKQQQAAGVFCQHG